MKPERGAESAEIHAGCTSASSAAHIPPKHLPRGKSLPRAPLLVPHGCILLLSSSREQGVEHSPLAQVLSGHTCLGGRVGHPPARKSCPRAPSPALLLQKGSQGCLSPHLQHWHEFLTPLFTQAAAAFRPIHRTGCATLGGEIPGLIHTERTRRWEKGQWGQRGRKGRFLQSKLN